MMFPGWFAVRRMQGTNTPPVTNGQSVADAEEIVRCAWRVELLRQRDRLQFAARAAEHDCGVAHQALAAAQREGDARAIAAAHQVFEKALEASDRSTLACERTLQVLQAELALLAKADKTRASKVRILPAAARPPERHEATVTAQPRAIRRALVRTARRVLAVLPSERRVYRWLRRLVLRRATVLGRS